MGINIEEKGVSCTVGGISQRSNMGCRRGYNTCYNKVCSLIFHIATVIMIIKKYRLFDKPNLEARYILDSISNFIDGINRSLRLVTGKANFL